ncbi:MAG: SagB/ThcOx family dehydrogenase [Planctomycetes bacterium]|nr:SagB/ThcOx family dehydrogenase [Planctomycetota bacterium]
MRGVTRPSDPLDTVLAYHEATRHHYDRYANSLGYLDWATQPDPFRRFAGSERQFLPRTVARSPLAYDRLFDGAGIVAEPCTRDSLADFLRHALAVSAWKRFQHSRWALRVNPSSGNLHPTEGYLLLPPGNPLGEAGLFHYVAADHALERRAVVAPETWRRVFPDLPVGAFLVALSSILWREAWKYGERSFRYCQHDVGHALAALRLSASLAGWRLQICPEWSHAALATVLGLDRPDGFLPEEREEPELLALVWPAAVDRPRLPEPDPAALAAWRGSAWSGTANRLSQDHHEWPILGEVADATQKPAGIAAEPLAHPARPIADLVPAPDARRLLQQRRSAVAMDGRSSTSLVRFVRLLQRVMPAAGAPWDALHSAPQVHLLLFVHRVDGLVPGVYLLPRSAEGEARLRALARPDCRWQRPDGVPADLPLWLLLPGDCRSVARNVSCAQDIAGDGFFSLGMLAHFEPALRARGAWFYRNLFWETGVIGQVLYLEAEALGARGTGIGCFFDEPALQVVGLSGLEFRSLYHFTVGMPVEDPRLTTEPGYGG